VHANRSLVESGVSLRTINVALRLAAAAELGSSLAGLAVLDWQKYFGRGRAQYER
jgi:hypothetical protein